MAGTIAADTLTHSTAGSLGTQYVVNGSAKAWLNINQTSTQAIRDSFGISSIADSGTGLTTVTVSNAFANNDYLATIALRMQSTVSNTGSSGGVDTSDGSTTITTTAHRLSYINTGSTGDADTPYGGSSIQGDLA
tara:strand:+ start:688 stop:1092 length:405 start_codon:yes stop_codon:yes gene_type:complete